MQVRNIMGKPERLTTARFQVPFFGPRRSLIKVLKAGDAFEEWKYQDESTIYLIWFGSAEKAPRCDWQVLAKFSYPKGVAF